MSEEKNQVALFESIPQDAVVFKKIKKFNNCVSDIFHEVISERKISLARVQKDTEIPFPTLDDWIKGRTIPLTDENIMILARYLNLDLEYLLFGIGSESSIEVRINRIANHFKVDPETIFQIMEGELEEVLESKGEHRAS